ncbi:DNA/RNA helicase domain-containing protein [Succinatimonas hippei]|uniref:Schlafen group 3-like DNA/RNA helicase domain-containing protein n=1 Tax=Succinatimonas hippei (strain DSM 22608 / JCM 16073 / KCTC 15190 / YIT 12066) TaxID=762983 RepID=E8LID4_SUCHY|nr:DNA/RNA helicase domain-containing protein [Succinatimonas hippei]EFY07723.1 hypothetical protein HMPREF9444_00451 [Succinatimonas hippei YIT 12066]
MWDSEDKKRDTIPRAYYHGSYEKFILASEAEIYYELVHNSLHFDLTVQQEQAWNEEVRILKDVMLRLQEGYIALEYSIPRMGKRIDAVLVIRSCVILLEFKVFETVYSKAAVDQVVDYALDLHNFHEASHAIYLFPFLVCTDALAHTNEISMNKGISSPILCCKNTLIGEILHIIYNYNHGAIVDPIQWINSVYKPTPNIIEAAQALYSGHDVREISYKESDDNDIAVTTALIDKIIADSKKNHWKSICFVTGVPGAGKTLVGLNIANKRHNFQEVDEEHAVFLSGNEPLVTVLREALTRDQAEKKKMYCKDCKVRGLNRDCISCKYNITKEGILSEIKSFIQMVHEFRDDSLLEGYPAPIDKIAIFDEAQRSWKKEKLSKFMRKKGKLNFDMSEPECLIEYMNRHKDWAVIICLVGGGQEIYDGEAGIAEWFNAINEHFPSWKVFCSDRITDYEYVGNSSIEKLLSNVEVHKSLKLHLSVSMRSFRSEYVSDFAKAVIDGDEKKATELYQKITQVDPVTNKMRYPILLTRNLQTAKEWVRNISQGTERYGIIASSRAKRLRAEGVIVPKDIEIEKWFLNGKNDVNSSYFMEVAASEFKIQGLEVDYAVVVWEADYRYMCGKFTYNNFIGSSWVKVNNPIAQDYQKNSYRVLLTRARQGYIIYVPKGNVKDVTRNPEYYDCTYNYLKKIGVFEV